MIVEMRTYTLAVGATSRYFALYAEKGLGPQTRILGRLVGYYAVEVGGLNQVCHLWAYDSFEDRQRRRAELWADADWLAYAREVEALGAKARRAAKERRRLLTRMEDISEGIQSPFITHGAAPHLYLGFKVYTYKYITPSRTPP